MIMKENIERIEIDLISKDVVDVINLIQNFQNNPKSAVISLGLAPFFALVAEGSNNYFKSTQIPISSELFFKFPKNILKLRVREKYFDDNSNSPDRLPETLKVTSKKSNEIFSNIHTGFLRSIKRRLQPNLGIYFQGEYAICTTQTALLTTGFTTKNINEIDNVKEIKTFITEFSFSFGQYFKQLSEFLKINKTDYDSLSQKYPFFLPQITHNDFFDYKIYKHISSSLKLSNQEISFSVLFIISQINFVEKILKKLLPKESNLFLRSSFISAYHATRSLEELINIIGNDLAKNRIGSLLNNADTSFLLNARKARNFLAHYEFRDSKKFITSSEDPINEMLLGLYNCGRKEVSEIVIRQLQNISNIFISTISKSSLKKYRALFGDHS